MSKLHPGSEVIEWYLEWNLTLKERGREERVRPGSLAQCCRPGRRGPRQYDIDKFFDGLSADGGQAGCNLRPDNDGLGLGNLMLMTPQGALTESFDSAYGVDGQS